MSTEAPAQFNPYATRNDGQGNKRSRGAPEPPSIAGTANTPPKPLSPLAAALAKSRVILEPLHTGLQGIIESGIDNALTLYARWHYKNLTNDKMQRDPSYIPSSCRIGLDLQAIEEVQRGEDFTALVARKDGALQDIQLQLAEFAKEAHDKNTMGLRRRFVCAVFRLLQSAVLGLIAQYDVKQYASHRAIVDLLATNEDSVLSALNITRKEFLEGYKDTHQLVVLPKPSVMCSVAFLRDLDEVNGPPPEASPPAASASPQQGQQLAVIPPSAARQNGTNAALALMNQGGDGNNDATMEDMNTGVTMIGGRSTVLSYAIAIFKGGITDATAEFHRVYVLGEETKRIKAATKEAQLSGAAERIGRAAQNERSCSHTILQGLIREETSRANATLAREVQSLRAQLDNEKSKNKRLKNHQGLKDHRGDNGGTAANKSKKGKRPAAAASSRGTPAANGGRKKNQGGGKWNGKRRGSSNNARN